MGYWEQFLFGRINSFVFDRIKQKTAMGVRSGIIFALVLVMGIALSVQKIHRPDRSVMQLGLYSTDKMSVLEGVSLFGDGHNNKLSLEKGSKLHSAGKESLRDTIQMLKLKNIQESGNRNNQQSKKEQKSSQLISNIKKNTDINSQKISIASKKSDNSKKKNEMTSLSSNSKKKIEQKMGIIDEDEEKNEPLKNSVSLISQRILTAALPSLKKLISSGKLIKKSSKTKIPQIFPDQVDKKPQLVKHDGKLISREALEKKRAQDTAYFNSKLSFQWGGTHKDNQVGKKITNVITKSPAKDGKQNQGLAHQHSQHAAKTASGSLDDIRKMDDSSGIQGPRHQGTKIAELQDSAQSLPNGKSHISRKILSDNHQHLSKQNHHQHHMRAIQLQNLLQRSNKKHKQIKTQNEHHQPLDHGPKKPKYQSNIELHNGHHQSSDRDQKKHKDQTHHFLRNKQGSNGDKHQQKNMSNQRHLQSNPIQAKISNDQIIVPTVVSHRNGDYDSSLPPGYRSGNSGQSDFASTLKMSESKDSALTSASYSAGPQPSLIRARVTAFRPKKGESGIAAGNIRVAGQGTNAYQDSFVSNKRVRQKKSNGRQGQNITNLISSRVALFTSVKNGQVKTGNKWDTKGPLRIDRQGFQAARNKFSNQKQARKMLVKQGNSNLRSNLKEQMSDLSFTKLNKNRRKQNRVSTTGKDSGWERNE